MRRGCRVDVLHRAAQQAVQLPVGGDPVEQAALPVAVAVGDPSWTPLVGVDDMGSWHRGARLPSVRSASPSLLSPLLQVRLLRLGHLAHQHWHPIFCLALNCAQQ